MQNWYNSLCILADRTVTFYFPSQNWFSCLTKLALLSWSSTYLSLCSTLHIIVVFDLCQWVWGGSDHDTLTPVTGAAGWRQSPAETLCPMDYPGQFTVLFGMQTCLKRCVCLPPSGLRKHSCSGISSDASIIFSWPTTWRKSSSHTGSVVDLPLKPTLFSQWHFGTYFWRWKQWHRKYNA